MRSLRLFAAIAAIVLLPACAYGQGAALLQKPITAGNCATLVLPNIVADSGVGCDNSEITVNDGVHPGTLRLVPTVLGLANSPGILNGTSAQPLLFSKSVASTGTDGPDFDFRRTANYSGGTFGFVNTPARFLTTVSAGTKSFEWGLLSIMDNSGTAADLSQNVAGYFQAHKRNGGGTWALTAELLDHNADPASPSVTFEYDMQSKGTDTGKNRVIQDLWGKTDDGNATVISFAQRFNTDTHTTFTNGLTTDGATISNAAVAIGSGQKLCLDGITCANYLTQSAGTTSYVNGGVTALTTSSIGSNVIALNSSGQVTVLSGQPVCFDGTTCSNKIAQSGGTTTFTNGGVTALTTSSIGANVIALNSSGQISVQTNQKVCLNGSTCSIYILFDGTSIGFYNSGVSKFSMNMTSGNGGPAGAVTSGLSTGVTCGPASPSASWASNGGINTHC